MFSGGSSSILSSAFWAGTVSKLASSIQMMRGSLAAIDNGPFKSWTCLIVRDDFSAKRWMSSIPELFKSWI